ncbi:MAG: metallophosphoesterase [Caldilineaceae bacterium]
MFKILGLLGIALVLLLLYSYGQHAPLLGLNVIAAAANDTGATAATTHFAIIGDFGVDDSHEAAVATLVKSWNPDFIVTVGDNNYPSGAASTMDRTIGKYYQEYIAPYHGTYGSGSPSGNRFYPTLGNHDWYALSCANNTCQGPHFDYFTLPGNERYYDFVKGPVHLFIIDSDSDEPDGVSQSSAQAAWLQARLASSTAPWHLVLFHHPPYTSGTAGSFRTLRWPFSSWGVDAVITGHDHDYERLLISNQLYLVDGLGGRSITSKMSPISGSQVTYIKEHGALLVDADNTTLTFRFIDVTGKVVDTYSLTNGSTPANTPTNTPVTPTNTPTKTPTPQASGSTATPTQTPASAPTATPDAADLIFSDTFEGGTLAAWSSNTNGSAIQVSSAAAQVGQRGVAFSITSNTGTYLTDNSPNSETHYRVRFYFDPNSIPMASGDSHYIFGGYQGSSRILRMEFRNSKGQYQIRVGALENGSTWKITSWYAISDASHTIEMEWRASTTAGANDGFLTLWIDGLPLNNISGLDNDTRRMDSIRLGPLTSLDSGTRGAYYFDDFVSRRQSYIGSATAINAAALDEEELEELEDAYIIIPEEHPALAGAVQPDRAASIAGTVDELTVTATFAAGAVDRPVTVLLHGLNDTALPNSFTLLGTIFTMQAFDGDGIYLDSFAQPVTLQLNYAQLQASVAADAPLYLQRWNGAANRWEAQPATIDPTHQTITVTFNQPATLGIFQRESQESSSDTSSIYLPLIQAR